jgi:hypothetical protein
VVQASALHIEFARNSPGDLIRAVNAGEPVKAKSWARFVRVSTHVAVWIPFLIVVAHSMHSDWRAVGDGAEIALRSWMATSHAPLVGQPTQLGATAHGEPLHDLGPLEYWLLAIPVRTDPVRGVLWGAALCGMAAASLAVEAGWAALGEAGGLLVTGIILGMIAWSPGLAFRPYWNPCFGAMFFLAALAACWAVMSGRRWWWPVLVIMASVAAQAHLMFAIAAALLVLLALSTGLVDASREKKSRRWAVAGLIAGLACWAAPIIQQITGRPGNLTALVHSEAAGRQTGLIFALKGLAATIQPPPFWWPYQGQPLRTALVVDSRSAPLAVLLLALVAASMLAALFWLRSRSLATLAAIGLLTSGAALLTFSRIPQTNIPGVGNYRTSLSYLMLSMVPAGLLDVLTIGTAVVLTGQQVIRPRVRWAGRGARAAAVPLLALAAVGVISQLPGFPGDARGAEMVSAATRRVERAVPPGQVRVTVVAASSSDKRRVALGLAWALTGDGYDVSRGPGPRHTPMRRVTVFLHGSQVTRISVRT